MKMKKILFVFSALLALFMLVSCTEAEPKEPETIRVTFVSNDPYMGSIKGSAEQTLIKGEPTAWVIAEANEGFEFVGWSDGITDLKRENEVFDCDTEIKAIFALPSSELPLFSFHMESGDEVTSKTEYTPVTLSISNTDTELCFENAEGQLRGRGNATWKMEKKSYRLKLTEKMNLLGAGRGEAKDWILLANHCDQTLMRNYLAFHIANQLDGFEYASSGSFVEVIINGDYKGVYLLCEQVEVQKNRVNIEVDPEKLDTGYLIELDQYADDDEGAEEGVTFFRAGGQLYSVKSDATAEQVAFIQNFISEADSAILKGNKTEIEAIIDLDSCVDMYLLQEFMLNIDVGWSSLFMYKKQDGGKLYFGPVWDFDLAAGNDKRLFAGGHEGIYVADGAGLGMTQESRWFIALMKQEWFKDMVLARWEEVKPCFAELSSFAEKTANSMKNAIDHNFERWDIFGQRINQEPDSVVILSNYRQHSKHLYKWLDDRYEWLDNYFQNQ